MKIKSKLLLSFVTVALFSIAVAIVSLKITTEVKHQFHQVISHNIPLIEMLGKVRAQGLKIVAASSEVAFIKSEKDRVEIPSDAVLRQYEAESKELQQAIDMLNIELANYNALIEQYLPEKRPTSQLIGKTAQNLITGSQQLVALTFGSDTSELQSKLSLEVLEDTFIDTIEAAIEQENIGLSSKTTLLNDFIDQGSKSIWFIAITCFFLALLSGAVLASSLSNRMDNLTFAQREISRGKLTTQLKISGQDEIGELEESFNFMSQELLNASKLKVDKEFLDNIMISMIDILLILSPQLKILGSNRAATELLGYTEKELTTLSLRDIIQTDAAIDNILSLLKEQKQFFTEHELILQTKTGKEIPVQLTLSPLIEQDNQESKLVCLAHDMTARMHNEEKLNQINEELVKTNNTLLDTQSQLIQSAKLASVGEMATGIAHELNQPLSIIALNADIELTRVDNPDPQKLKSSLTKIITHVERATRIIDHLRTFGRDSKRQDKSFVDLNTLLQETCMMLNEQLRLSNIIVDMQLCEATPKVYCNQLQIEQVITNLLLNAKDAMKDSCDKNLIISTGIETDCLTVTIADSGCGMDKATMENIFNPFFTTKEFGKGTGLGLSISYGIIKDHQGKILVDSTVGKGTIFTIALPISIRSNDEATVG